MTAGADSTCCHGGSAVPLVRGSGIQVVGGVIQLSGPLSARRDYDRLTQLDETQTTALVERLWASVSTPLSQTSVRADIGVHHEIVGRHLDSLRDAYLCFASDLVSHSSEKNTQHPDGVSDQSGG